jgi:hypothetical protein
LTRLGRECSGETLLGTVKNVPKESIIFVPLELPTIGTVSGKKRQLSQDETVSLCKTSGLSRVFWLQLVFGGRELTGHNGISKACGLVGAIAEWLVGGMSAAA